MRAAQFVALREPLHIAEVPLAAPKADGAEEIGPDVRTLKVGDRVTLPFHEADGTCPECRAGFQNLCDHMVVPGFGRTGDWAQYATVTAADPNCIRLPDRSMSRC